MFENIRKDEKQGIWTITILFYLIWISSFFDINVYFNVIAKLSLGIIGFVMIQIMFKSIKEKEDKDG